jgi:hypothetical protein
MRESTETSKISSFNMRQGCQRGAWVGIALGYLSEVLSSPIDFGVWRVQTTFKDSVCSVRGRGSRKQMFWPNTLRDIAGVANQFAFGNDSEMELPRNAMSRNNLIFYCQKPIAVFLRYCTDPKPTVPGFMNIFEETIFQWRVWAARTSRKATASITSTTAILGGALTELSKGVEHAIAG